jgi:hypothetical protein
VSEAEAAISEAKPFRTSSGFRLRIVGRVLVCWIAGLTPLAFLGLGEGALLLSSPAALAAILIGYAYAPVIVRYPLRWIVPVAIGVSAPFLMMDWFFSVVALFAATISGSVFYVWLRRSPPRPRPAAAAPGR